MILLKIWLAGVALIWLLIILRCIFYLCYDWRWYFKGELPPRSVAREVRRLVKQGRLKEPVPMNVEMIRDSEGVVITVIMRFGEGILCFCDTIRREFLIFKLGFCATFLLILFWPGMLVAGLMDMANGRARRQKSESERSSG